MSTHYVIYVGPMDHGKVPMLKANYDMLEEVGITLEIDWEK